MILQTKYLVQLIKTEFISCGSDRSLGFQLVHFLVEKKLFRRHIKLPIIALFDACAPYLPSECSL